MKETIVNPCKHCGEVVVKTTVVRSTQPWTPWPWKHAVTHLIGCFTPAGNPTGRKAEPKEGN